MTPRSDPLCFGSNQPPAASTATSTPSVSASSCARLRVASPYSGSHPQQPHRGHTSPTTGTYVLILMKTWLHPQPQLPPRVRDVFPLNQGPPSGHTSSSPILGVSSLPGCSSPPGYFCHAFVTPDLPRRLSAKAPIGRSTPAPNPATRNCRCPTIPWPHPATPPPGGLTGGNRPSEACRDICPKQVADRPHKDRLGIGSWAPPLHVVSVRPSLVPGHRRNPRSDRYATATGRMRDRSRLNATSGGVDP